MSALRCVVFAEILSIVALAACSDRTPSEPARASETVLVTGGETGQFTALDPRSARIVGHIGPIPRYQDAYARSPDSATLYVLAHDTSGGRLIAVDIRALSVRFNEPLPGDGPIPGRTSGLVVYGDYGLAVSPDGQRLFIASAIQGKTSADTVPGIAVLDANTRSPVGFIGPMWVQPGGLVTVRAGAGGPDGAILIVGRRYRRAQPSLDWLYTLDPVTLAIRDSVAIVPPNGNNGPTLLGVVPAPDRQNVYVFGVGQFYKYDLVGRHVTASAPLPGLGGGVAISPDGQTLYLTDAGDFFNTPGAGFLYLYGPNLEYRGTIDLRAATVDGALPATKGIVVSRDGTLLYVSTGTASRGPIYGAQPARVLVVDVASRTLLRSMPLNDWNPGALYLR